MKTKFIPVEWSDSAERPVLIKMGKQVPPSPRPSPPGEGESLAVLMRKNAAGKIADLTNYRRPNYRRWEIFTTVVGLAALVLLSSGCGKGMAQQTPPPPTVTVAPAEQREIVEWDEF